MFAKENMARGPRNKQLRSDFRRRAERVSSCHRPRKEKPLPGYERKHSATLEKAAKRALQGRHELAPGRSWARSDAKDIRQPHAQVFPIKPTLPPKGEASRIGIKRQSARFIRRARPACGNQRARLPAPVRSIEPHHEATTGLARAPRIQA